MYKTLLLLLFILGASISLGFAQVKVHPGDESRLWIEGRSNINQFECEAQRYDGIALFPENAQQHTAQTSINNQVTISVDIEVDGFECGRSRMNRDLREALRAKEYPKISFVYTHAEPLYSSGNDDQIRFFVHGELTVSGYTRQISFEATGFFLDDGRMRTTGSKRIRMTDYEIEPPTGLLGIVRAEDNLTVHFDLYTNNQILNQ